MGNISNTKKNNLISKANSIAWKIQILRNELTDTGFINESDELSVAQNLVNETIQNIENN